jgi:amino acid transporter
MATASSAADTKGLARGAIGLREVLFQAVTSMAPAGALALSISLGATYAGGALPLAVLLALVGCLLVASSIGQLAKHLPSAGSIYTYPAAGIHPSIGFLVGWGYSLIEMLIGPTTMVLFGYLVSSVTQTEFHWPFTATWVIFMIAAALVVGALNFRGIVVSAGTGTVLGALEILVFVVLAVWLIVKAGSGNTGSVFTLHYATIKGYSGFSGVVAGSVYTILAFIGFEAAAPLAEEARNPRRTIGVAVFASCLAIGLFYVLGTYAGDVFFGPNRFDTFGALNGGSPWIQLARDAWGIGWVIAFLAIANSTFANGNAGTMATTRTWYAMGRVGVLPRALAATHPRYRSPYIGVIVQFVLTLAIGLPLGIHFGPVTTFALLATILTGIMVAIYIVFNLSCILYYLRFARSEFNWFLHLVVPVVGILAFLPAWFTALGIGKAVLKFVSPLSYPISETGLIIGIWFVIGLVVLIYLYARHPARLPEMRQVFSEEPVAAKAGSAAGREGA